MNWKNAQILNYFKKMLELKIIQVFINLINNTYAARISSVNHVYTICVNLIDRVYTVRGTKRG